MENPLYNCKRLINQNKTNMEFYKIKNPKTEQFLEAVENMDYFIMDQLEQKREQLKVYFSDLFYGTPMITFLGVSNTGGYPIIFDSNEDAQTILEEFYDDWDEWDSEEQEHKLELFWSYANEL